MGYNGQYEIATAIRTACFWEVTARKLGNVHRCADFAGTTYLDFILSAGVIADRLSDVFSSAVQMRRGDGCVGLSIRTAVYATSQVAKSNTNLGITLLLSLPRGCLG